MKLSVSVKVKVDVAKIIQWVIVGTIFFVT